ncbi:MAG: mechanosensitive ion channel family protein [Planctomycetota bacterium]
MIVEAEAWQELVKAKVRDIAFAEIAVKQSNKKIEEAATLAKKAREAEQATAAAEKAKREADQTGDAATVAAAEKKAKEAEEAARELEKEVAAQTTKQPEEVVDTETAAQIEAEVKKAEEKATQVAQEAIVKKVTEEAGALDEDKAQEIAEAAQKVEKAASAEEKIAQASEAAKAVTAAGAKDAKALKEVGAISQEAVDSKEEQKTAQLERINALREERTALVDRFGIVLDELEKKGGDPAPYRQYIVAVTGITIDWWDPKSAWISLAGWFKSEEGGLRWVKNVLFFVLTLLAFWVLSWIVGFLLKKSLSVSRIGGRMSSLVREFLVTMTRRVVLVIGFVIALSALEFNLGPVLAVIGAAGFVVAFALQDSLSNFASGIMILIYRPFDVDDVVDVAGVSGKVRSLSLVSTTINTFDNKVVIVPNNSVWGSVITNANASKLRRVDMVFGIGYADDMAKAQGILEDVVGSHEKVLREPETVIRVHELADSSVNYVCRPWVKAEDYWEVYWDVTRSVKERFDSEGVSIPFPQRDLHIIHENAPDQSEGAVTTAPAPAP